MKNKEQDDFKKVYREFKQFLKKEFKVGDIIWEINCIKNIFLSFTINEKDMENLEESFLYVSNVKKIIIFLYGKKYIKSNNWNIENFFYISAFINHLNKQNYLNDFVEMQQPWKNNDPEYINKIMNRFKGDSEKTTLLQLGLKLFLEEEEETNTIFFAREFSSEKTIDFYNNLKNVIENELNGMTVVMLEEDAKSGVIHEAIKNEIKLCKFFIADLSSYKLKCEKHINNCKEENNDKEKSCKVFKKYFINNNVMWELGYASALKKPILCVYDNRFIDDKEIDYGKWPFDIFGLNLLEYGSKKDNLKSIESIIKIIRNELLLAEK